MKRVFLWVFLPSIVMALVYQSGYRKGLEAETKKIPAPAPLEDLQTIDESRWVERDGVLVPRRQVVRTPSPVEAKRTELMEKAGYDYKYEKYADGKGAVLRRAKKPELPKRTIETAPIPAGVPLIESPGFARSGAKVTITKPPEGEDCGCNKINP